MVSPWPMCHDAPMARPRLDFDQLLQDPFRELKRIRPAGWLTSAEGGPPIALSYDGVRELLSDGRLHANFPDFLRFFGVTSGPFYDWMAISPLNRDGADHVRWRTLMSRTFTPRSVERLRPF